MPDKGKGRSPQRFLYSAAIFRCTTCTATAVREEIQSEVCSAAVNLPEIGKNPVLINNLFPLTLFIWLISA